MKPCFLADNRFTTATATSAATDFPAVNVTDRRPYTVWKATSTATQEITVSASGTADTLALAGHNLAGATVEVQVDGKTVCHPFTVSDNNALMKPFGREIGGIMSGATATGTSWKVILSNLSAVAYIGVLMVGKRIEAARFPAGAYPPETIQAETQEAVSKAGHLLGGTIRFFQKDVTANLQYPGAEWTEGVFKPFYLENAAAPFFFGWDLIDWPEKCGLYRFSGPYAPVYDELGRVKNLPVSLKGVHA